MTENKYNDIVDVSTEAEDQKHEDSIIEEQIKESMIEAEQNAKENKIQLEYFNKMIQHKIDKNLVDHVKILLEGVEGFSSDFSEEVRMSYDILRNEIDDY